MTKRDYLTAQAKSMVAMTRILEGSSETRDNLLAARQGLAKATSVEISNNK